MQVVDLIVREPTLEQRNRILSTAVGGGDGDKIPSCSPDEIALAVGQLIDEMERMAEARLVFLYFLNVCLIVDYARIFRDELRTRESAFEKCKS